MKVTVVGTGYVGLVTGACFSEVGHEVLCVDSDARKIALLHKGQLPIFEEGLQELVERNVAADRLKFTTSIEEGTQFAEVIFVAVGTPPSKSGEANLSYVEQVGRQVAGAMRGYRLLVEKSTVPVNTSEQLKRTMRKYLKADVDFDVASNPEFLREGVAIPDALQPARIVVGVESERARRLLRAVYQPLMDRNPACAMIEMDIASAELTKHASNSFLALKISFINAVARICELTGANVEMVARGMGMDPRIGPQFLRAGVGYGGSCFPKDVDAFIHIAEAQGYDFGLLKEVQRINQEQRGFVFSKIKHELWVLENKKIAILGLAFKPGTDDTREAPALYFVQELTQQGAQLKAWDPVAAAHVKAQYPGLVCCDDLMDCVADTDLVLIMTEWPQIKALDLDKVRAAMKSPVIIDGRNIFDPEVMAAKKFIYHSVGRASVNP